MTNLFPWHDWIEIGIKVGLLTWLLIYLMFALIMVRQIYLMTQTITTSYRSLLLLMAYLHLGLTLLIAVIVILV